LSELTQVANEQVAQAPGINYPTYAFHDPEFVTWWLGSLYMLKPIDQITVAEILRDSIHIPVIKDELDAFIQFQMEQGGIERQVEPGAEQAEIEAAPEFVGTRLEQAIQSIKFHFNRYRKENPWMVIIAGGGLAFLVVRGLWFAAKEVFRIVF
jgi:hypothetical protein